MKQIEDIRQSDSWSTYLARYNWQSFKLGENITIRTTPILFLNKAHILRPKTLSKENLGDIDAFCKQHKIFFIKISPNYGQDLEILKKYGYKETKSIELPSKTMVIDLEKTDNQLWNNLTSKGRYNIRKADRDQNYTSFIRKPNKKQIDIFYEKLQHRSRKKNFYVQSKNELSDRLNAFGDNVYIANVFNKNKRLLGTKLFFGHDKGIWGIYAATTALGQKSCGGYKLLWDSFEYFRKLGYKQMDLDGLYDERLKKLSQKWIGYTYFKRQFKGKEILFPMPYVKYFNIFAARKNNSN